MKKYLRLITDKKYRFQVFDRKGFYKKMSDEKYLKKRFKVNFGYELDLNDPKTFNEKLQWLKLYDRRHEYTSYVDKYAVKKHVADIIGEEYIIPTIGVWDSFDLIDFDSLPDQFVLKCTHDSGGYVICRDRSKFDVKAAEQKITECLGRNYYLRGREWPYKNVKPRIIAERLIGDATKELSDYKFMCYDGEVRCSFVCSDRFSKKGLHVTFFDLDWNVMPFERYYPCVKEGLPKPENYELMITLAQKLSKGIPFVRVDFYETDGKVYFGELTFYPGGGYEPFEPVEWDEKLGSWIKLPEKTEEK